MVKKEIVDHTEDKQQNKAKDQHPTHTNKSISPNGHGDEQSRQQHKGKRIIDGICLVETQPSLAISDCLRGGARAIGMEHACILPLSHISLKTTHDERLYSCITNVSNIRLEVVSFTVFFHM